MSDSAKPVREIEDVLASIRRLVSENPVPQPQDVTQPQDPGIARPEPASQRLVLTPALRVAEPDDPWAPVSASGSAAPAAPADPAMTEEEDPSWDLEDRLSDWGKIEDRTEEAGTDGPAEQAVNPERPLRAEGLADLDRAGSRDASRDAPADFAGSPPAPAEFEPETGDADWPDRSAGRALRDLALARGQGGDAAAGDMSDPADAMLTSPKVADRGIDMATDPDEVETPTVNKAARSISEDQTGLAAEDTMRQSFTPVFSRRIDVRRPAFDDTADDAAVADDSSARPVEDRHAQDAHVEDLGEMRQPFTFPETEDGLLDEETLRDIIAEVVREELQGVLGQRITRNVRKMVRREIRLALAAEDFE